MQAIKHLVNRLVTARKEKGMGQGDFENIAGFKQQQISRMEKGADMKLSNFIAWADALDYDVTLVKRGTNVDVEKTGEVTNSPRRVNIIHDILAKAKKNEGQQ